MPPASRLVGCRCRQSKKDEGLLPHPKEEAKHISGSSSTPEETSSGNSGSAWRVTGLWWQQRSVASGAASDLQAGCVETLGGCGGEAFPMTHAAGNSLMIWNIFTSELEHSFLLGA